MLLGWWNFSIVILPVFLIYSLFLLLLHFRPLCALFISLSVFLNPVVSLVWLFLYPLSVYLFVCLSFCASLIISLSLFFSVKDTEDPLELESVGPNGTLKKINTTEVFLFILPSIDSTFPRQKRVLNNPRTLVLRYFYKKWLKGKNRLIFHNIKINK